MQKDTRQFIESLDNGAKTALKSGDRTPSGAELSDHAANQANRRGRILQGQRLQRI